mgnify:CR=1 FL=1
MRHGVNAWVIADPAGELVWASPALPGAVHDLTAARAHRVITAAARAGMEPLADKGYQGAGGSVTTPHQGRGLTRRQRAHKPDGQQPARTGRAGVRDLEGVAGVRPGPPLPRWVGPMAKADLALELTSKR